MQSFAIYLASAIYLLPEEIAVREGIHEIIQAEIHHEDTEAKAGAVEMLEVPRNGMKIQI